MSGHYLVTGCAGFIGSAVSRRLLADGATVLGVDNLNDAYDPRLKQWRLEDLRKLPGFSFEPVDICDRGALERVFVDGRATARNGSVHEPPFGAVFNLAACAGVRASVARPEEFVRTNVEGTLNVLEACRASGVPRFILASTSSVYGASTDMPYREDSDTTRPLSPYAASKQGAEALCHPYHYLHGIHTVILRFFTVYGPAGRPDMSVLRFVRRIAEGEPITIFGDGSQRRDFTYVDDIAQGAVAALNVSGHEVINLGGDQPVPLMDVVRVISECLGREPIIHCRDAHPADVPATWANISKAGRLLHWRPSVDVTEGLQRTVDWYRANRDRLLEIDLDDAKSAKKMIEPHESIRPME